MAAKGEKAPKTKAKATSKAKKAEPQVEELTIDTVDGGAHTSVYDDSSIKSLKGPDRIRKRPQVVFGSDGLEGCEHAYFEILANAVDEAREGYGNLITTTVFRDHSIEVEDHGRGIPLGYNEQEQRYNWDLIFCEMYAGGKYDNKGGKGNYKFSLGLNGLGACGTQCSSVYMNVTSYKGDYCHSIDFARGFATTELRETKLPPSKRRTGTVIRWLADLEVFTDIEIPHEFFRDVLYRQSIVNANVAFELKIEQEDGTFSYEKYLHENGIAQYVSELAGQNAITMPVSWHHKDRGRDRENKDEYTLEADFAFCLCTAVNVIEYYHNSSFLVHGGSPDKALRTAFVFALDKYMRENGKYQKDEPKITFQDIAGCLIFVCNSRSDETSFENQTKKSISNTFIQNSMTEFLKQQLTIYLTENPLDADRFAKLVLINRRSREAAENAVQISKKKLTAAVDSANRVEKFVNCRSKDPERRELYIVEGDSALTSCKLGRNAEFQAIIPVRGKTLNCMKSTYEKIFSSDIIVDLLRVIGCGVELHGKAKLDLPQFDINNLKWSKIIICTDADEDGFQIRTLLLTLFYRLLPTLLKEGKVFIAESPLFEITTKDKTLFAYDEPEKVKILKELGSKKYTIQRSKGLGENEPEMMWQTTMNPATRRLIAVRPTDEKMTLYMFDTLLGEDIDERKRFITKYGGLYLADIDV